jgi:hypothetical protein
MVTSNGVAWVWLTFESERIELIAREFIMNSVPGQGTHITVYVTKAKTERMKKCQSSGGLKILFLNICSLDQR